MTAIESARTATEPVSTSAPDRLSSLNAYRGFVMLLLAGFYSAIDLKGYRGWSLPLLVVGMNSIAMYCMAHLFDHFIRDNLKTHLGRHVFEFLGTSYEPMVQRAAILLLLWLICLWMYSRKVFLRI